VLNSNEKPFEVFSDKFMLEVIFSNLIENAIKYSRAKAEISIDLHHNSGSWSMSVTDKGMGIPSAELPYIFEKFYRVPVGDVHDIKGYGIGLYYVKQIVDMLQGEIKVNSKVNEGTNFKINFKM
jgi:two-component system phosphate regulon sensor histidine kinase PhoR